MPIAAGTRLGPYEISGLVGAGGMGEVYRAVDHRLQRAVALKVLPALAAADHDRIARFEQEARATAALNHPNIVALYDVGTAGDLSYVVSELLTGATLRERIAAGPMPPRKILEIGIGILSGLAAAHERGIAHRDLKPENVFITTDGTVKILDFGLAKLTPSSVAAGSALTVTSPATTPGLVLGTVGYMAPEQVRGLPCDHRADIFAFGAVVYEMLTGRRVFEGATTADTMTAILTLDPPDLPAAGGVPPALNALIRRCLEKDARDRFQSARDLAFALQAVAADSRSGTAPAAVAPPRRLAPAAAIGATAALGAAALLWTQPWDRPDAAATPAVALSITMPEGITVEQTPAVAPDGGSVAFVGAGSTGLRIFVRSLDTFATRAIPGTDGGQGPFWSPDSRSLGFFARGRLWRAEIAGGMPRSIAAVSDPRGGTWGPGDVIVYAPDPDGGLFRVHGEGGAPSPVTTLDRGRQEISHRWPRFLPGGRHLLFMNRIATAQLTRYVVSAVPLSGGAAKPLLDAMSPGVYDSGRLLFGRDEQLLAQRFDPETLALSGAPEVIAEPVWNDGQSVAGLVGFDAAAGILGWRPALSRRMRLAWKDRDGRVVEEVPVTDALHATPSHDGRFIMVPRPEYQKNTVGFAIFDRANGSTTAFTAPDTTSTSPVWSPDNRRVVYSLLRDGAYDLYIREVRPGGREDRLLHTSGMKAAQSWSPDGRLILFNATAGQTRLDLWAIEARPGAVPRVFAGGEGDQCCGRFSPDGRWIAYVSSESGRLEVFVRPAAGDAEPVRVSKDGGGAPEWNTKGHELYFLGPDNTVMSVAVATKGDAFTAGQPSPRFRINSPLKPGVQVRVSSDTPYATVGDRFLVAENGSDGSASAIHLTLNWAARREVPLAAPAR